MREKSSSENPGTAGVLAALRALEPPPSIPREVEQDGERLADLLFDHFESFTPVRFFSLLAALRLPDLAGRAEAVLERSFLFLEPQEVARRALVKLVTDVLAERRIHPYRRWEDRALEETAEALRDEPGVALLKSPGGAPLERAALADLVRFYNSLARPYRRLVWRVCIQGKTVLDVSKETGIPYERVEWILTQIDRDAEECIGRTLDLQLRYGGGEDAPRRGRSDVEADDPQRNEEGFEGEAQQDGI